MTKTISRKTIITIIVSIAMLVSLFALFIMTASAEAAPDLRVDLDTGGYLMLKDTDGDGLYDISNYNELRAFAVAVRNISPALNGELTKNVVANSNLTHGDGGYSYRETLQKWSPMGTYTAPYVGTFDGAGYSISGLYSDDGVKTSVGLFGFVGEGGTVKNVGVIDSYLIGFKLSDIAAYEELHNVGAIAACNSGTIENCYSDSTLQGGQDVGGIVGENYGIVKDCYNLGYVGGAYGDWSENTGGIVGYNNGTVENCRNKGDVVPIALLNVWSEDFGGIVGNNQGLIINCQNTASISGHNVSRLGGITGLNYGTVELCYNTATIESVKGDSFNASISGIVGLNGGVIKNCYNTGTVKGFDRVSGIANLHDSNDVYVANCFNTGSVTATNGTSVGSLFCVTGGEIKNCYYKKSSAFDQDGKYATGILTLADVQGKFEVIPDDGLASGKLAYLLQEGVDIPEGETEAPTVWGQDITGFKKETSPLFGGVRVYYGYPCGEDNIVYTNNPYVFDEKTEHVFGSDGYCTVCDHGFIPALLTEDKHDIDGDGVNDAVYEISEAPQLYWFINEINGGNTDINGILTKDIVVNENLLNEDGSLNGTPARSWILMTKSFFGIFDGAGHTVSGLYLNEPGESYIGLFGYIDVDSVVRNVGVVDSFFSGSNIGGVVGNNDRGLVENCYSRATVIGSNNVGGVVGWSSGVIRNCYNTGDVTGEDCVGGVVGTASKMSGTTSGAYVLGSVENCYNTGDVSGTSTEVGGVVGYLTSSVRNCYNTGNVKGEHFVGGVVGRKVYSTSQILNCYYPIGAAKDDYNKVQNGVGNINEGLTTEDVAGASHGMNAEQFLMGEIAYLLGEGWGQDVRLNDTDTEYDANPVLGGKKVYKNQIGGCTEDSYIYSYDNESKEIVISHSTVAEGDRAATCTTRAYCSICESEYGDEPIGHHSVGAEGDIAATCLVRAYCSVCDSEYGDEPIGYHSTNSEGDRASTCMSLAYCSVCEIEYGVIDLQNHVWNSNGFCLNDCEGAYMPAELVDGYYQISNGGQLFWFANYVNTVDRTASAKLISDVDLESRPWTPIGSTGESNNNFRGHFDGQGYTIDNLNVNANRAGAGFFGEVRLGTVESFIINGTVTVTANNITYIGGVIGSAPGANADKPEHNGATIRNIVSYVNVTVEDGKTGVGRIGGFIGYANHESLLENCVWYGTLDLGDQPMTLGAGGFVGRVNDSSAVTFRNCAAYGEIANDAVTEKIGVFMGFTASESNTVIANCLAAGSVTGAQASSVTVFGTWSGATKTINNSYYAQTLGISDADATALTSVQLASGEAAYLLGWGQKLNVEGEGDALPKPIGAPVYKNQIGGCNEQSFTHVYSNEQKEAVISHADEDKNHICDRECGETVVGSHTDGDDADHLCDYCNQSVDEECYDIEPKDHNCDECGAENITGHRDAENDSDHLCDDCDETIENCTPNPDDGDCTTDITCSICGVITSKGAASHTGGTATCTSKAKCDVCGKEYGEILDHTHSAEWKNDENSHWNECSCGDKANNDSHADINNDEKCDTCEYDMPISSTSPEEITTKEEIIEEVTTEEVTTEEVTTEEVTTEEVTTEEVTTDEGTTEEITTEEETTEEGTTEEVTTEEKTTEEVTTEEVTTEEVTTEEVITEEVITEEVITDEVTTDEITTDEVDTYEVDTDEVDVGKGDTEPVAPEEGNRLGVGGIVAIAAGSVVVVGLGGFALVWFVIKKKSLADLLKVFKR